MPLYVLMRISTTNDNTNEEGVITKRLFEFESDKLYEQLDACNFDELLDIVNQQLPKGIWTDAYPEPDVFIGEIISEKYKNMLPDIIKVKQTMISELMNKE